MKMNLTLRLFCLIRIRSFYSLEVQIFVAVKDWIENKVGVADIETILSFVRLPLMSC